MKNNEIYLSVANTKNFKKGNVFQMYQRRHQGTRNFLVLKVYHNTWFRRFFGMRINSIKVKPTFV